MNAYSISNIAWPAEEDPAAISLVAELGFDGVELAPCKAAGSWEALTPSFVTRYRSMLESYGLAVSAFQGIFYAVEGASLFESDQSRSLMLEHCVRVAEAAAGFGAVAMVYGAPATRDASVVGADDAAGIAVDWLRQLGEKLEETGVCFCFEANPTLYNCNFVNETAEAQALVAEVDHPLIRIQIDTGTVFANDESSSTVTAAVPFAGHVHVSEPSLTVLGSGGWNHDMTSAAVRHGDWSGWISVEMRTEDPWRDSLRAAADVLTSYGFGSR